MKKILFALVALMCSMSMNAQVMKVMKGNTVVATYTADQADNVVFEEAPAVQPYSVKFEKGDPGMGETDFTGFEDESSTITASNDDVTIALALSGDRRDPIWNEMGDIMMALEESKLTITVTPKNSGVTVTGIEYIYNYGSNKVTKTGAGPWQFDVANDKVYDGSTQLGRFYGITVNYTK